MVSAIVLAAGQSSRMGGRVNKQFLELCGKPLLWFSLAAFEACPDVGEVVLVRRPDCAEAAAALGSQFAKVTAYVDGGPERQNSVWNGLTKVRGQLVAVHDGARPLVTPALISATIRSAEAHGSGIAATKVVDTIKEADENRMITRTIDRSRLWAVQTPQTIRTDLLRQAYQEVFARGLIVTDEAAAVELLGYPLHLVETPFLNLKVTTPADLRTVEALLQARQ